MTISGRILKTIKKIALDRNIHEDSVSYQQIATEQAIELNNLFELRKVSRTFKKKNIPTFEDWIKTFKQVNGKLYQLDNYRTFCNAAMHEQYRLTFKVDP